MGVGVTAHVGGAPTERGDLRRAKRATGLDEAIVDRPRVPVQLVDGPRYRRGFLQTLDTLCIGAGKRLGERRAGSDERVERPLIQTVDARFERRRRHGHYYGRWRSLGVGTLCLVRPWFFVRPW